MSDTTQLADQFLHDCSVSPDVSNKISKGKSVSYVIDINQGSYQSGIITLDATNQLTGSQGYASLKDAYITVPYVVTLRNNTGAALAITPNSFMAAMKCNTATIIDKVQIELNGKTIITPSGYLSHWNNFRAMTEWSTSDVHKYGASSLMYPDDVGSIAFSGVPSSSGDGYLNNNTSVAAALVPPSSATGSAEYPVNSGFVKRLFANPPVVMVNETTPSVPAGLPTMFAGTAAAIAAQTGKGATVLGAATTPQGVDVAKWHYLHRIRLVDIHPIFKELDLCANPQLRLTLYINTGNASIECTGLNTFKLSSVGLTQGNTCPVMVASAAANNTNNGILTSGAKLNLAWGVLGNSITPTSSAAQYYPYSTTRMYIPFYDLLPEKALEIVKQPVKKSRFLDYYVESFKGRAGTSAPTTSQVNANFSLQISASIKNAKYVALIPFANTQAGHFSSGTPAMDQYASPFDSAPWTFQAGSCITNFNVQVGNKWVYNTAQNYDFQGFLDEFSKLGALNGGLTHELANGLIDEDKWAYGQRVLVADLSRHTSKDVPQSLLVSGTNASAQGSDFICIVAYEREIALDRTTGEVQSFT